MDILACNDDGIHAPGLATLVDALRSHGRVHVVAPEVERSAVGHAITISTPLKARRVDRDGAFFGYAVSGTPADCVKLAVRHLLDAPPDLVLSGINHGPNAGISVLYSGTVSAATEGTILGIPSAALSINTFGPPRWDTAAAVTDRIVGWMREHQMPADTLLNVNIPNLPAGELKGIAVVPMARSRFVEEFHQRQDPRGNTYYWMDGVLTLYDDASANDVRRLEEGYVTVTPIMFDLTNYAVLDALRADGPRL